MSAHDHHRWAVTHAHQHPYKHSLSEFPYAHDAFGGEVVNVEQALNWILAVLYPNSQDAVATVGDLPAVGNTLNDYRVVNDDGDGNAASYRWEQREGDASAKWYKIYDMDWGADSILSQFMVKTQDIYVHRLGYDDIGSNGSVVAGTLAGQSIYGGRTSGSNLSLFANSGDGVGANTGFVQFGDNVRPIADSQYSLGTTGNRWLKLWTDEVTVGTMTITDGLITDTGGTISFANEHLVTTGNVDATEIYSTVFYADAGANILSLEPGSITDTGGMIDFDDMDLSTTGSWLIGTMLLEGASITDSSGEIDFGATDLVTTGSFTGGSGIFGSVAVDDLLFNGNSVSIVTLDTNLVLQANGTGVIDINSAIDALGGLFTGTVIVTGQLNVDNLRLDGNVFSSTDTNGNITFTPNGSGIVETSSHFRPATDSNLDIGASGKVWNKLWLDGAIGDGTTEIAYSVLSSLRDINSGVNTGYSIFWNGTKWISSLPDTEIDHGLVAGLLDDDHTQYALLAGRAGGQTIIGGLNSGDDLILESTAHATKGDIYAKSNFSAFTDAAYSGGWAGTDIGDATHRFRNVYTAGEFVGLRLENLGALPSSSAQRPGRLLFYTSDSKVYVDTGSTIEKVGSNRYETDTVWDGSTSSKSVTVSGLDARKALWQLKDNTNNYKIMHVDIHSTGSTNVTITSNVNLTAGSYRLIGIE